ncbi:hypothetical protein ABAC460_09350 [Asticcacaulis sp. AC460]|nr:hypothetical protein ABAC460_09350 [Asticcacaulis sp. AC460]
MSTVRYSFRRLTPDDLDLVNGWILAPHVAQWWVDADGPAEPIGLEDFDEPDFRMWLVMHDGVPFAYMQDYDPHLYPGHHFADRPAPARGIDQFIGVADMVGKGHGSAFIRQRAAELFDEGAVVVVTDPHPSNGRAIRAYEKAGFIPYGEGNHPQWWPQPADGLHLLIPPQLFIRRPKRVSRITPTDRLTS